MGDAKTPVDTAVDVLRDILYEWDEACFDMKHVCHPFGISDKTVFRARQILRALPRDNSDDVKEKR